MRNLYDDEDEHDYSPNELAMLVINGNKAKSDEIVLSNLEEGDTVYAWEQRNLEAMQKHLKR